MHKLLNRQLKRSFGNIDNVPKELETFIELINQTYKDFDENKMLEDRAMEISSQELKEAYERIRSDIEHKEAIFDQLKIAILKLRKIIPNSKNSDLTDDNIVDLLNEEVEVTLKLNNELLFVNHIVDKLVDAVQVCDEDGNMVFLNQESEKRFMQPKKEILGKNIKELDSNFKEKGDFIWNNHVNYLKEQGRQIIETTFEKPNGETFPMEVSADYLTIDKKGYVIALLRDISERKAFEEEKQEREARFKSIFENPNIGASINTLEGDAILINETFTENLGYQHNETENLNFEDIIDDEYKKSFFTLISQLKIGKIDKFNRNFLYKRKDNTTFWGHTSTSIVRPRKKETYLITMVENIDEKIKIEELKNKYLTELENANEKLKDYAHMVSHDLKAPLRGISTIVTWIREDHYPTLNNDIKTNLDLVYDRVVHMENLINDILEYSSIESTDKQEEVNVLNVINFIFSKINVPKHIQIKIDQNLPSLENYEKIKIYQIFQNLISNAIKYSKKENAKIELRYKEDGENAIFILKDNGIGIDKKYHDKIFSIFQRLDANSFDSTGVGLAIVKKILNLYNGSIFVESELGKGSSFILHLPKVYEKKATKNISIRR